MRSVQFLPRYEAAELADGAAVALFVISGVTVTSVAFIEYRDLVKSGHAAHPQC
jgi:hypothetical protein